MSTIKKCKDCGISYPETRDYFGQYKNQGKGGVTIGFRNSCRKCMASRTSRHSKLNPLMVKKRQQRRANAEESAQGEFTDDDIIFIRSQVADNCRFCGTPLNGKGEIEHPSDNGSRASCPIHAVLIHKHIEDEYGFVGQEKN